MELPSRVRCAKSSEKLEIPCPYFCSSTFDVVNNHFRCCTYMLAFCTARRFTRIPRTFLGSSRNINNGSTNAWDDGSADGSAAGNGRIKTTHRGDWGLSNDRDDGRTRNASRYFPRREPAPPAEDARIEETTAKPSLMEQLFPAEATQEKTQTPRDLPFMPLNLPAGTPAALGTPTKRLDRKERASKSQRALELYHLRQREMERTGELPTVLLLRNASTNLTEDDFRRVIPQGQHLEGWSIEQSSFLKVVPGRDLATLEQQNFYYLLFANQMAAFSYQGHVSRLSALVGKNTPSSVLSPAPVPRGYRLSDGTDLYAALQSYSLTPPSQPISLRQLKPPLSPLLESILQHQGYHTYVHHPNKLPYEVRLTMDGPQLHLSTIQFILHETALARSLGWSGREERIPRITEWQPHYTPSALDKRPSGRAATWRQRTMTAASEDEKRAADMLRQDDAQSRADALYSGPNDEKPKRRVRQSVYVVGFHTERAAQDFIRYWHRRPMVWEGNGSTAGIDENGGDLPAIANAELLW
nr:hypothetical protein CFP56_62927 [Quercus suber]